MTENLIKKKYVISIWDELRKTDGIGYEEKQLMVIGSDENNAPTRAFSPKLTRDVNGNCTLTFQMYLTYYDEELGEQVPNPICEFLTNERHIKLHDVDKNKWYDFILKGVDEDSKNHTITYTAKDYFVNELSKNGFDIELKTDLRNNQGTVRHLARKVLDGTDWKVEAEILENRVEQPLYKPKSSSGINVTFINGPDKDKTISITSELVYVFYDSYQNGDNPLQVLILDGYKNRDTTIITNDDRVIINEYQGYQSYNIMPTGDLKDFISEYRGARLVKNSNTLYDPVTDRVVTVYKRNDGTETNPNFVKYYGYENVEYVAPTLVDNLMANSSGFTSTSGWEVTKNGAIWEPKDKEQGLQIRKTSSVNYSIKAQLYCGNSVNSSVVLSNSGIYGNRAKMKGLKQNQTFYFRCRSPIYEDSDKLGSNTLFPSNVTITWKDPSTNKTETLLRFNRMNGVNGDSEPNTVGRYGIDNAGYVWFKGTVSQSAAKTEKQLDSMYNIAINITLPANSNWYFTDFQLFEAAEVSLNKIGDDYDSDIYIVAPNGYLRRRIVTGGRAGGVFRSFENDQIQPEAQINKKYYYYVPVDYDADSETVKYEIYDTPQNSFIEVQITEKNNDGKEVEINPYEKVKSIEAAESNRFDILSQLCEKFECWMEFDITRDDNSGQILNKQVYFKPYLDKTRQYGFSYGLNLNSVRRSVISDQIATKIIVKQNSNKYAEGGFCTIADATSCPTGENFFFNFDYFVNNGMLNKETVTYDLFIEFYPKLRGYNANIKDLNGRIQGYEAALIHLNKDKQIYETMPNECKEKIERYDKALQAVAHEITWAEQRDNPNKWKEAEEYGGTHYLFELLSYQQQLDEVGEPDKSGGKLYAILKQIEQYEDKIKTEKVIIKGYQEEKEKLIRNFNNGYIRFIQEGVWTSEDYTDPNLYYYDQESVLYESSRPKTEYTFDVIDIGALDEFSDYQFDIGDKTWAEDTEFFGWIYDDIGTKVRPFREEVVVYEYTEDFDDPRNDKISVKTYKSQFEDLFQRIGNTVNSLEYNSGAYERAADLIKSDGTLDNLTLQKTYLENASILATAIDQSVISDSTGITITSSVNPNEMVRLVNGGIFLSTDGGQTWHTGVTGRGISADQVTTGVLNTGEITIMNGDDTTFSWTSEGIFAYKQLTGGSSKTQFAKFSSNGLEIYNGGIEDGHRVFWTDSKTGDLHMKGTVFANAGEIGKWKIDSDGLIYKGNYDSISIGKAGTAFLIPSGIGISKQNDGNLTDNFGDNLNYKSWVLGVGNNFGIDNSGILYAKGANITGNITANSGTIGNVKIINNQLSVGSDLEVTTDGQLRVGKLRAESIDTDSITSKVIESVEGRFDEIVVGNITADKIKIKENSNDYLVNTTNEGTYINQSIINGSSLKITNGSEIAGWRITDDSLISNNGNVILKNDGTINFNNETFKVDSSGTMYQNSQHFNGSATIEDELNLLKTTNIKFPNNASYILTTKTGFFQKGFIGSNNMTTQLFSGTQDSYNKAYGNNPGGVSGDFSHGIFVTSFPFEDISSGGTTGQYKISTEIQILPSIKNTKNEKDDNAWIYLQGVDGFDVDGASDNTHFSKGVLYGTWYLNSASMSIGSDKKLKNSIEQFSQNYSTLFDNLKPVRYKLNNGTSDRYHTGFIAQEVYEAIQQAGLTTKDFAAYVSTKDQSGEETLSLRYEEFIALLCHEVQKLKSEIKQLKSKI